MLMPSVSKLSIRSLRQWLLLLAALLLFGCYLAWSLYEERLATAARENEHLIRQTTVVHDNLARQFESLGRILSSIRRDLPRWQAEDDNLARANHRLSTFVQVIPGIQNINVLNADGEVIASGVPELIGKQLASRAYFQHVRAAPSRDTLYVSPPFTSTLGPLAIALSRALFDEEGNFAGVVMTALNLDAFSVLLDSVNYASDMWAVLIHANGTLFGIMPPQADILGKSLDIPAALFSRHLASGRAISTFNAHAVITDDQRLSAFQTFQPPALQLDAALVIAAGRTPAAIFEPWREQLALISRFYLALCALAFLSLHVLQRRQHHAEQLAAQAEQSIREQRERLDRLAENVPGMLYQFILHPDGSSAFPYASPGIDEIYAVSPEQVKSDASPVFARIHPDDLASVSDSIAESAHRLEIWQAEYRVILPRRGLRWLAGIARPQLLPGRSVLWHGYLRDISATKAQELALRQAKDAADSANAAKGLFLANISHEIRTPMNAALGMLQLLARTNLDQRQRNYVANAESAAQILLALLNDVLDLSRIEAEKLQLEAAPCSLDELLGKLSPILASSIADKPVEVIFQVDPALPQSIITDALRLHQILLNLTTNAIKFTAAGEVVLELQQLARTAQQVSIGFTVRDSGIGIADDRLQSIFDSFTQAESGTTRQFGGSGLGLAICQRLVKLMGGTLSVHSTKGVGSSFHFSLDFALDPRPGPEPTARHPGPLRTLVVDHHPGRQTAVSAALSRLGWPHRSAGSWSEALALLTADRADSTRWELLLLADDLPDNDCRKLLANLQHRQEPTPEILILSSLQREASLARRATDEETTLPAVLIRPVTGTMIRNAVRAAATAAPPPPALPAARPLHGVRILVVEDNPLNQQIAAELLEQAGAIVELADNGLRGVDALGSAASDFDLVLMDIQMPVMDGFEAARLMRSRHRFTGPIIAMTANTDPASRLACAAAGMDDHLGKPVHHQQLLRVLSHHLHSHPAPALDPNPDPDHRPASTTALPTDTSAPDADDDSADDYQFAAALARLGGNQTLHARLAADFIAQHADSAAAIAEAVQTGQLASARSQLHTLKGLAASLGANALARAAANFQQALAAEPPPPTEALQQALTTRLAASLEAFARLTSASPSMAALPPRADAQQAPAHFAAQLTILDQLLAEQNMRALELSAELPLTSSEAQALLAKAVQQLDFDQARRHLAAWLRELETRPATPFKPRP